MCKNMTGTASRHANRVSIIPKPKQLTLHASNPKPLTLKPMFPGLEEIQWYEICSWYPDEGHMATEALELVIQDLGFGV